MQMLFGSGDRDEPPGGKRTSRNVPGVEVPDSKPMKEAPPGTITTRVPERYKRMFDAPKVRPLSRRALFVDVDALDTPEHLGLMERAARMVAPAPPGGAEAVARFGMDTQGTRLARQRAAERPRGSRRRAALGSGG